LLKRDNGPQHPASVRTAAKIKDFCHSASITKCNAASYPSMVLVSRYFRSGDGWSQSSNLVRERKHTTRTAPQFNDWRTDSVLTIDTQCLALQTPLSR
jgi:hypothetical protein